MQSLKTFITESITKSFFIKDIDIKSLYIDELSEKDLINIINNKKNIEEFAKSEDPFSNTSMWIRKEFYIERGDGYIGMIFIKKNKVYLKAYFPNVRDSRPKEYCKDILIDDFLKKGSVSYIDDYDNNYNVNFSEKDRIEVLKSILKQYQYNVIGKILTSSITK